MAVFSLLLDIAILNAWVIATENNEAGPYSNLRRGGRKGFQRELGMALIAPLVQSRAVNTTLHVKTRVAIETVLMREIQQQPTAEPTEPQEGRARCRECVKAATGSAYKKNKYSAANKVKQRCGVCRKPVCNKHSEAMRRCKGCSL